MFDVNPLAHKGGAKSALTFLNPLLNPAMVCNCYVYLPSNLSDVCFKSLIMK